jgi:carbonic anhydrase
MASITPKEALSRLREGNQRFVSGKLEPRDIAAEIRNTASGAQPFAAVLGCIDSRVPPELVFDQGLGALYCARVAGNIVDDAVLASLEFACCVSGAALVVVLGHSDCGAVKGACNGLRQGTLTKALEKLAPAIAAASEAGGHSMPAGDDPSFVRSVARENVTLSLAEIKRLCPALAKAEAEGQVDLVGAFYDVETGEVVFSDVENP